ncbi:hypothetical protein MKQ68_06580 [Chitinophaga horti]|uniref:PH domain-containing protein n=1 Tax=Chitinophaga horti TaxID=2920382 RepID=A0ABY6J504_9BACT|nr:hypothetical protein [Chitinophaga horti]UYQ94755.1 hypothetical protein MKQ68_06580 [Chitinophaga horti]
MHKFRILHPNAVTRLRLQPVMHGMVGVLFLFNAIGGYRMAQPNWGLVGLFIVAGLASLALPFQLRKVRKFAEVNTLARLVQAFLLLSGCLFFLSHMIPFIAFLLLCAGIGIAYIGYAEYKILQPAYAVLDTSGVSLPTIFAKKLYPWNELNNVVLRNELFTLDFKNNKLMQLEVLDEMGPVEAAEINDFCEHRLGKRADQ